MATSRRRLASNRPSVWNRSSLTGPPWARTLHGTCICSSPAPGLTSDGSTYAAGASSQLAVHCWARSSSSAACVGGSTTTAVWVGRDIGGGLVVDPAGRLQAGDLGREFTVDLLDQ